LLPYFFTGAAMVSTSTAERITRELGGDWHGHYGTAPAPGHSKHDRSLSIRPHRDDPDDVIIHAFAGEDWQDIKADLRSRGILLGASQPRDRRETESQRLRRRRLGVQRAGDEMRERRRIAEWLWSGSRNADGTAVVTYLGSRGILVDQTPATIRFSPACPPKYPCDAMIAAFGIPDEPEPGFMRVQNVAGIHFTLLRPDGGGKAGTDRDKFMVGRSTGWPIVVATPGDSLAIVIGEGIETVLSIHQETGFGAWAAGTAGRMPELADKVPDWIECVTIAAEGDSAGQRGAHQLADRLAVRGIEVRMMETANA
jgi:hypothetical protein